MIDMQTAEKKEIDRKTSEIKKDIDDRERKIFSNMYSDEESLKVMEMTFKAQKPTPVAKTAEQIKKDAKDAEDDF